MTAGALGGSGRVRIQIGLALCSRDDYPLPSANRFKQAFLEQEIDGGAAEPHHQGDLHTSLYLVQSQRGKLRQLCVRQAWQARVREAVNDYRRMQELIEAVSESEWKRLRERKR